MRLTQFYGIEGSQPTLHRATVLAHFLAEDVQAKHRTEFEGVLTQYGLTWAPDSVEMAVVVDDESVMWGIRVPRWRLAISAEVVAS